jgi:hypothetical protein
MAGRRLVLAAAIGAVLVLPSPVSTHRLDEYLQATRLGVSTDTVDIEIDLTAGVAVASRVWALVDADRNGRISDVEGRRYAQRVLQSVLLQLDDRPAAVALVSSRFPSFQQIHGGSGTIHLEARAALPPIRPGPHRLLYRNTHRRDMSVYLVNALVPADAAIVIGSQKRDPRQTQMEMVYEMR